MRDERIDVLRAVGLIMIVLAHTEPAPWLFQLRNFDVPLMVLVSGLSFAAAYRSEPYLAYVWNRSKRLVLPVWIFLTAYFGTMAATGYPSPLPALKTVAGTYLLLHGIGFVWIIRVFLLVALLAPFIYRYSEREKSDWRYLTVIAVAYCGYEIIGMLGLPKTRQIAYIYENFVLFAMPYVAIFALGLRLPRLSRRTTAGIGSGFAALFFGLGFLYFQSRGEWVETQEFKYPAKAYYLSYALMVSCVLWLAAERILNTLKAFRLLPPLLFFGQNSIWVYLWHIPLIEIIREPYWIKFPLVLLSAGLLTAMQAKLLNAYVLPRTRTDRSRKFLRVVLTG